MSRLDDMCEEIRLARLNNQSYRFIFGLFDLLKGLLKLSLLACFAVGIWYLTYGFENTGPASTQAEIASVEPALSEAPLTEEQIAMLREFANRNRDNTSASIPSTGIQGKDAVVSAEVPKEQTNAIAPATRDATTEPDLPLPDISAKSLLADLEEKLGSKRVAEDNVEPIDGIPSVVESPIIQASVSEPALPLVDSEAVLDSLPETSPEKLPEIAADKPAVKAPVASADSVKDAAWILDQNPKHFVIQIGSTTNRPFLVRFEKSLPEDQPTAIFEMLIGKAPENTLTFGLFDTNELATAALGKLSQRSRRYGAYVRKLSAVQKQIRDLGNDLAIAQKAGN